MSGSLTTREAADRLGVNPRSVVWAIKRGYIKAEKRGRDYWIEEEEVERYKRERRPAHRPKADRIANTLANKGATEGKKREGV